MNLEIRITIADVLHWRISIKSQDGYTAEGEV